MGLIVQHETDKHIPWFFSKKGIETYKRRDNYVVLDVETTNFTTGLAIDSRNHLVLACWTVVRDGEVTHKHRFADEYDQEELLEDIRAADFMVAHNAKFELQWLEKCGLDLRQAFVYDTMVSEWVIQGNRVTAYDLDSMAKSYKVEGKSELVSRLIKRGVNPAHIPKSWLLEYCKKDVAACHEVFMAQEPLIDVDDSWHLVLARNILIPVLADIETVGLTLDKEAVYAEEQRLQSVIEGIGGQLDEITGGINLNSPKQLGEFLYKTIGFAEPRDNAGKVIKTPGGAPSCNIESIHRLVPSSELQLKFIELYKEYNNAITLLTKNVAFFKLVCEQMDGKFYGQLRQCRTANHRLASSGIKMLFKGMKKEIAAQIQNLPRQYKKLFTVDDPDYEVTEYDGSQIEFRAGGELSHDSVIEHDIVEGVDIHSFTRDTMNEAYKRFKIKKEIDRQDAKPNTFAPMYGSQGKDKAEQEYAKAWRLKYPDLYQTQYNWTLIVADQKKLRTPYGLTFYWPHATMHKSGYVSKSTEIFNLPISGFATGEIIPIALAHFWHRIKDTRAQVFNTVHDSIIVRNHKEEIPYVTEIAKIAMTHDVYRFLESVYDYKFSLPLGFGMKTGSHWGVTNAEFKWDVWPDGNERHQVEKDKVTTVVYDTRRTND